MIGLLITFLCIAIKKWGPRKYVKYFEPSIVIGGFLKYAPYNLSYYIPGLYVSYAFMSHGKKLWSLLAKSIVTSFNWVASIAFSSIIIFFTEMYDAKDIDWWGNNVVYKGMDYMMNGWLNATIDATDWLF